MRILHSDSDNLIHTAGNIKSDPLEPTRRADTHSHQPMTSQIVNLGWEFEIKYATGNRVSQKVDLLIRYKLELFVGRVSTHKSWDKLGRTKASAVRKFAKTIAIDFLQVTSLAPWCWPQVVQETGVPPNLCTMCWLFLAWHLQRVDDGRHTSSHINILYLSEVL